MRDGGANDEDELVWTSDTYVPPGHRLMGCFLALYGGQLAVVVGDADDPHQALWVSPEPPPLVPDGDRAGRGEEEIVGYYASLDDDGSLAVYRHRAASVSDTSAGGGGGSSHDDDGSEGRRREGGDGPRREGRAGGGPEAATATGGTGDPPPFAQPLLERWLGLFRELSHHPPKTRAAAAWRSVRRWTARTLRARPGRSGRGGGAGLDLGEGWGGEFPRSHPDECVYATGAAGCLTPGRHAVRIGRTVRRTLEKTTGMLDDALDGFVRSLSEGGEDDEDVLDTLLRVAGKAGMGIGKMGIRMGRATARVVGKGVKDARSLTQSVGDKLRERWTLRRIKYDS